MQQPAFHPLGRPGAIAIALDARERLERDAAIDTQVVVLAAQPEDRGAHRAPHVECEDARTRIAAKRSEEHTSELQSLMRISYAVFCLKKKHKNNTTKPQKV